MNGERDPRDAGGKDDADRCTVGEDHTPAALAPEADSPAPAIRRDPAEGTSNPLRAMLGSGWLVSPVMVATTRKMFLPGATATSRGL
jgi:hypothetical protein